ncbi:MAG TPA: YodL domain-containing protein, partial [Pyrinomonadaceae bacterium]
MTTQLKQTFTVAIIGHFEQIAGVGRRRYYYHVGLDDSTDPGIIRERVIAANFIEAAAKARRLGAAYGPDVTPRLHRTEAQPVCVLLNRSSRLAPYADGDLLEEVWHGHADRFLEPLDRDDPSARHTDEEILDSVYYMLNQEHPDDYRQRSLSVGDVVVLDHNRAYAVEGFGFRRLELWGSN